ncbi:MAG: hypothetical protein ACRDSZ_13875 [Pseudonocardiaceae bacterium]
MAQLPHALDTVAARLNDDTAAAALSYLRDVSEVHRDYSTSSRRRPP